MKITTGNAKNVHHSVNQEQVGSGENKSTKTVHTALFEVGGVLVNHKRDREQIPISEGDALRVVYRKRGGSPKKCLAYVNESNGATQYPSAIMDWFLAIVGLGLCVTTFVYPHYFLGAMTIPNVELSFAWIPRVLCLLLAAGCVRNATKTKNIRSLLGV